jgi:transposase-like protein
MPDDPQTDPGDEAMEAATEHALDSIMTVGDIAREAGVSPALVKRWLGEGLLAGKRRGLVWLSTRDEVSRFLRSRNSRRRS